MKIKYNRVSTLQQTGLRFTEDKDDYDLVLLDKISVSVKFRDRPQASKLVKLIEEGKVEEVIFEDLSRAGRNTGDVISTLEWLENQQVNVIVRNIGLQSRPDGKPNPIWKMITAVMSSLYEMELSNIKERTTVGRLVYVQNGGVLGRHAGSNETELEFLNKPKSRLIIKNLRKGLTIREISAVTAASTKTIQKVKNLYELHGNHSAV
jgi:DNA invertase Pin-like site-specific DNA recombinase